MISPYAFMSAVENPWLLWGHNQCKISGIEKSKPLVPLNRFEDPSTWGSLRSVSEAGAGCPSPAKHRQ